MGATSSTLQQIVPIGSPFHGPIGLHAFQVNRKQQCVHSLDIGTADPIKSLSYGEDNDVTAVLSNRLGTMLALISIRANQLRISLWSMIENMKMSSIDRIFQSVPKMAFSSAGDILAIAVHITVCTYSSGSGCLLKSIKYDYFTPQQIGFSGDGARLVVEYEGHVRAHVYNTHTGEPLLRLKGDPEPASLVFGMYDMIARIAKTTTRYGKPQQNLVVHNVASGRAKEILVHDPAISRICVCFGRDDLSLFAFAAGELCEYDCETSTILRRNILRDLRLPRTVTHSIDRLLFNTTSGGIYCLFRESSVDKVLVAMPSTDKCSQEGHPRLDATAILPCHATTTEDCLVVFPAVSVPQKQLENEIRNHVNSSSRWDHIAAAQGAYWAVNTRPTDVDIFDLSTGRLSATICHTGRIEDVHVDPSGTRMLTRSLCTSSSTSVIMTVWNIPYQTMLARAEIGVKLEPLRFNESGTLFVIIQSNFNVYDTATAQLLRSIRSIEAPWDPPFARFALENQRHLVCSVRSDGGFEKHVVVDVDSGRVVGRDLDPKVTELFDRSNNFVNNVATQSSIAIETPFSPEVGVVFIVRDLSTNVEITRTPPLKTPLGGCALFVTPNTDTVLM